MALDDTVWRTHFSIHRYVAAPYKVTGTYSIGSKYICYCVHADLQADHYDSWRGCSVAGCPARCSPNTLESLTLDHGPNIYKDIKPEMSAFLKNWPVKVRVGMCLSVWGPRFPPGPCYTPYEYMYPCTYTQERGRGGRWLSEKVRGALVHSL
jgi:hypothetical protein